MGNSKGGKSEFRYFVPGGTIKAVEDPSKIDNLALLLGKFSPFREKKEKVEANFSVLRDALKKVEITENAINAYKRFLNDYLMLLKSLNARMGVLQSQSRLVVGLGDESVYEVSIRLLRNYGIPYIPGSAVKGVTRAWAVYMMAELLDGYGEFEKDFFKRAGKIDEMLGKGNAEAFPEKVEISGLSKHLKEFLKVFSENPNKGTVDARRIAETLMKIFGTTEKMGEVVFFDALPSPAEEPPKKPEDLSFLRVILEFDIMNPHYGPYYSEGKPPGDWYSPVPVILLTVAKGTPFLFAVARSSTAKEDLTEKAWTLMKLALKYHGVGAKTALGYGRFE
ncbi:CRISPR-associated RAMP Cmr6 [Thermococcus sp. 2319x1]|uniref:type III-B CRISPR module RAMP protein Cmr6 n=1 Tax=Thermococcus sp. 2319x1 TaxID=1674923 RepID=UPI00073A7FE7|nr:type III-B CRISPR module RAMP protein Cmr6 [Thermococcus sp. 2319x1]ALV63533.1 CRISPR-associated RAMP Cmr6 [Thermococcus sp. 2319x1]